MGNRPNPLHDAITAVGGTRSDDRYGDEEPRVVLTANMAKRPASRQTLMALAGLVTFLLVLLPGFLVLHEGSSNPAFSAMDSLGVASWARMSPNDQVTGSRWCIGECQTSERDASSSKSPADTQAEYASQLTAAGWEPSSAATCSTGFTGTYTCWLLDDRELDLWVRASDCSAAAPPSTETGFQDPNATAAPVAPPSGCQPTSVQIKVFEQIERPKS
jgi:hypothetical protein